jgi:hypothetical protein
MCYRGENISRTFLRGAADRQARASLQIDLFQPLGGAKQQLDLFKS